MTIYYTKAGYNNTRGTREKFVPKTYKDPNKNFWLSRLLRLIDNASDKETRRHVRFKMGPTTYKLVNKKEPMVGFYKRLASRKIHIFPEKPNGAATTVSRSAPLRKTEKSKSCYVCRKLKPNRMFYQRKDGTYFSGCIPCQKTIRATSKARKEGN
jgi:hypothetical protein